MRWRQGAQNTGLSMQP